MLMPPLACLCSSDGGPVEDLPIRHAVSMLEMSHLEDIKQFSDAITTLAKEEEKKSAAQRGGAAEEDEDFLFFDSEEEDDGGFYRKEGPAASLAAHDTKSANSSRGRMRRVQSMGAMASEDGRPRRATHDYYEGSVNDDNEIMINTKELVQLKFGDDLDDSKQLSNVSGQHPLKSSLKKSPSQSSMKRNVSFTSLEIRSYNITVGNAPTANGVPISLDWEYDPKATQTYDLETFEALRDPRREKKDLHLPHHHRVYLLMRDAGVSRHEINKAIEESRRSYKNRQKTLRNQPYEEALEKVMRKFSKLVGKKSK